MVKKALYSLNVKIPYSRVMLCVLRKWESIEYLFYFNKLLEPLLHRNDTGEKQRMGSSYLTCIGVVFGSLLAGCSEADVKVIRGPSPGIEYRNQMTAPWPWVAVVPSARALALKEVEFDLISHQIHFDIAFNPYSKTFKDVRTIVVDYTILPQEESKDKYRPERYFMVMSFYKIGKSPPCPSDFEVATTLSVDRAAKQEAIRFMARDSIEEIHTLDEAKLLTSGKKIMVNLD